MPFTEHDVSDPDVMQALCARLPRARSIPQVFVDGEHIGNDQDLRLRLG
ncbi:glutaredoxin family protein [Roseovarius litorisediminis]